MRVAAEKMLQPKYVAIVGAADDDWSAGSGFEQAHAAQYQGPHDPFAQFRLGNDQRPQLVRWNDQRLDRLPRVGIDQCRPARQLREFAQKRAGALGDNGYLLARPVTLHRLYPSSQDDGQRRADITRLHCGFADRERAHRAKPANALDFGRF